MGVQSFRKVYYITDANDVAIMANSPLGIKSADGDGSVIEGTHLGLGFWEFYVPSGRSAGWDLYVQTGAGSWTRDGYLSGTAATGNNLGAMLAPTTAILAGGD